MLIKLFFSLFFILYSSILTVSVDPSIGKYCTNIFGNTLNISIENQYINVTGNILGNKIFCPWQKYSFNNTNIILDRNKTNCINANLKKNNACPCPPDLTYNKNELIAHHTLLGNLDFNPC